MSSSSYARVQYANNNNSVIRRLGAHRDPTIQYVNFDDLYNKHNVNVNVKQSYEDKYGHERRRNEVTSSTVSWEEAPDLTNGWTIEKEVKVTSPMPNKGLDYVYAYSNGYNAYSEHDNYPQKKINFPPSTTTTTTQQPPQVNGYVDGGHGHGTAEYAHYADSVVEAETSPSVQPPVVMEASWSEKRKKIDKTMTLATTSIPIETIAVRMTSTTTPPPPKPAPTTEKAVRRNGNGVQSGWRPFNGPSTSIPNANVPEVQPSTESTLFYVDAQKNIEPNKEQLSFQNVPVFVMDGEPNTAAMSNVLFPNTNENEIKQKPKFPQFSSLQPSASISVSGPNDRPVVHNNNNNNNNPFQPNINRFERPAQQNLVIPSIVHQQQTNDRPNFNPPFGQHNRPQFNGPQRPPQPQLRPPQQHWVDRFNNPNVNGNRRPSGPFGMRNPMNQRPDIMPPHHQPQQPPMPSGPVGLAPQLQPNQGQSQSEQDHLTIRLPLPKPGVGLGSSPHNPLPGPPIFLPQQSEGDNNNDRIDQSAQQGGQQPQHHHPNDGQFGLPPRFPPHQLPNFRPQPQMAPQGHFRPPNFMPPQGPPPQTSTATSFIKNFFSKIFPFARSLDLDEDYTEASNSTTTDQPLIFNITTTMEALNTTETL
ncbi:hypothetical protein CHUAL_013628 [Chamberlinius hualienensis]